jgi:MFS family permease
LSGPGSGAATVFADANYRRLWGIGALSGIARWLEFLALGIYAYELTRSPPLVALLAMLRMMPYVALGFLMGALADRFDRRRLMIAATFVMLATASVMAGLVAAGQGSYTAVALATMIGGAFWTIDMPVRRRLLVDGVGAARVSAALGFDNATNYATRALGPLVGGAAYQVLGIQGIYVLIASAYAACAVLALRLAVPPVGTTPVAGGRYGIFAALSIPRELIFNRRFAVIMGVTLVYNLFCFPFTSMVPVIAQKDFLLIPLMVGIVTACDGIGGTVGALAVGMLGSERTLFRTYFWGTLTLLGLMLALSFRLELATAFILLPLIGAAAACFSATQYALVHVSSPPEVRGRATGVLSIFIGSSMFGHYLAGQLFGAFSSPQAIFIMAVVGGVTMVLLGLVWVTGSQPELRSGGPSP